MTLKSSLFCEWDWSSAGMATIMNFTVTEGHTCSSIIQNMTSSSAGHVFGFIPGCAEVSHFASLEFQCLIIIIIYFIFICLNRGGALCKVTPYFQLSRLMECKWVHFKLYDGFSGCLGYTVAQLPSYYLLLAQNPKLPPPHPPFSVEANCLRRFKRGARGSDWKPCSTSYRDNKIAPFHWAWGRSAQCSRPPLPLFKKNYNLLAQARRGNCCSEIQLQEATTVPREKGGRWHFPPTQQKAQHVEYNKA